VIGSEALDGWIERLGVVRLAIPIEFLLDSIKGRREPMQLAPSVDVRADWFFEGRKPLMRMVLFVE